MSERMEQDTFIEAAWAKSEPAVKAVMEKGADVYLREQPQFERAFEVAERTCACIDERVGGPKLGFPGSGIIEGKAKAAEIIRAEGLKKISSHEHCGAAALAFDRLTPDEQTHYGSADAYAQAWTKELASELGLEYTGHVPVDGEQHIARAIYYDGTGRFNPSAIEALPPGFLVSRSNTDAATTLSGVTLSAKIAFGAHGFGQRFETSPLLVVPVGTRSQLPTLTAELHDALKEFPEQRIHIDTIGIIAPEREEAERAA